MSEKTVLLYGDSLIWGVNACTGKRHVRKYRVDTVARELLGEDIEVVSEGLRGRTMFGENGWFPERDGLEQFGPIFASHLPITVIVFCLGTNDLNSKTRHTAESITSALDEYKKKMNAWCTFMGYSMPKIIIVSPTNIEESSLNAFKDIFSGSAEKIPSTVDALKLYGLKHDHTFIDMRAVAVSHGQDGIHLSEAESMKLGAAIAEAVRKTL